MADRVTICERFARDGLRHEEAFVPTDVKIEAFRAAGFTRIEATGHGLPDRIPAFRDAGAVSAARPRQSRNPRARRLFLGFGAAKK